MSALLQRHGPDDVVAWGKAGERTAAQLLADAAAVAERLPEPSDGSHVALVFTSDRYAFAAALLGAWARGHAVALPPNQRRQTVGAVLGRPEVAELVHDTGAGTGIRVTDLLGASGPGLSGPGLPEGPSIATAFTSGTTGAIQAWPKTAGQLVGEAATLARVFAVPDGTRFVATVPPTHIYGLLFSVLLPLVGGGAFGRETPLGPEAVAARVREAGQGVLITVPAHLRAAEAIEPGTLGELTRIFSSTAPLSERTAALVAERHGVPVTEMFGSTETGGIAHRVRTEGAAWRPLPGVSIDVDGEGRLRVDSPFIDPELPRPYRTADLAELDPDGGFLHRGRADGVVKVGGRRVSLRAMEEALQRQAGVDDAAVVAVGDDSGRGQRILAVVAGAIDDTAALKAALAERFERSTLPRRLRVVDKLPRETTGKLQRERVLRLFGLGPDGAPMSRELRWTGDAGETAEGARRGRRFGVEVPDDYIWFAGHFSDYPVMAGVVQLHEVVLPCVRRARPELGELARLSGGKFTKRIAPGDAVEVALSWEPGAPWVEFALSAGDKACSGGRLTFREGGV